LFILMVTTSRGWALCFFLSPLLFCNNMRKTN
jgi:hypothetical protein